MSMIPPPGAGNGPAGPPAGMAPPTPPPGAAAPGPPPGGALTPPMPPTPSPAGGIGAPAPGVPPQPSPYSDLSAKMPHAYQLLDVAARQIKMAIETGGFYKQPVVLAGVRKLEEDLRRIIQSYAKGEENDEPRSTNVSDGAGFDANGLGDDDFEGANEDAPEGA